MHGFQILGFELLKADVNVKNGCYVSNTIFFRHAQNVYILKDRYTLVGIGCVIYERMYG